MPKVYHRIKMQYLAGSGEVHMHIVLILTLIWRASKKTVEKVIQVRRFFKGHFNGKWKRVSPVDFCLIEFSWLITIIFGVNPSKFGVNSQFYSNSIIWTNKFHNNTKVGRVNTKYCKNYIKAKQNSTPWIPFQFQVLC